MNLNLRILCFLPFSLYHRSRNLALSPARHPDCARPSPRVFGFGIAPLLQSVRPSVRHLLGNERRRGGGEHADQTAHGRRSMPMRNAVIFVVWRENSSDDLGVVFYHVR